MQGTEGAQVPFFSPNGQWIGFFADGMLKRVAVAGGVPSVITKTLFSDGASWGTSDTIIYSEFGAGLAQVAVNGGDPTLLTVPDVERGEQAHVWPQILPGEKHVLFTVYTQVDARAAILSLETRDWHPLPFPHFLVG